MDSYTRVDVEQSFVLGHTALGEAFELLGRTHQPAPGDYDVCRRCWPLMESLIADGKLKPSRFQIREDGLEGIFEGLKILREGKNSAMKLVYQITN